MMAHVGLFGISSLVLLLIGTLPCCSAKYCSLERIGHCREHNFNTNGCTFDKKILTCLEGLKFCRSVKLAGTLQEFKSFYKTSIAACPALPEGDCPNNYLEKCVQNLPHVDKKMPKNEWEENCFKLILRYMIALNCIDTLTYYCPDKERKIGVNTFVKAAKEKVNAKMRICNFLE